MAIGFILQFDDTNITAYEATAKALGLQMGSTDNWPPGILSHVAGMSGTTLCVVDVWESEALFTKYRETRLVPAFAKTRMPAPRITKFEVHNTFVQRSSIVDPLVEAKAKASTKPGHAAVSR